VAPWSPLKRSSLLFLLLFLLLLLLFLLLLRLCCFVRRSSFPGREGERVEVVKSVEERPGLLVGRTGAGRMGRWAGRWRSGTSPAGGRRRLLLRGEGGCVGRRGEGERDEAGRRGEE